MDRHSISEAVVESEFTTDRSREICVSALGAKKISMDLWQFAAWCLTCRTSRQLK